MERSPAEVGTSHWLQETVGLYGREAEVGKLQEAYERQSSESTTAEPELFCFAGGFGTGKSYLIEQSLEKLDASKFLLGNGKFDQLRKRQPYSAIQAAFTQVCTALLQDDQDVVSFIVEEHMGDNAGVLKDLMPVLGDVLNLYTGSSSNDGSSELENAASQDAGDDSSSTSSRTSSSTSSDPMEVKNRFQYVFRKFVRTICKYKPLVLVIDDLQWADSSSLGLIQAVLQDKSIKRLLIVGAYRNSDIPVGSRLEDFLQELQLNQVRLNSIELGPLSEEDIGRMMVDCFPTSQDLEDLGTLVFNKTLGNAYFAVRLLDFFLSEKIILYDMDDSEGGDKKAWTWDRTKLSVDEIPSTIEDLIVHNLQEQSSNVQILLKVTAALGMYADEYSLNLIIRSGVYGKLEDTDKSVKDSSSTFFTTPQVNMKATLNEAVAKGFIIRNGKLGFKFTHDKVYQMAYSLLSGQAEKLHLEIGRLMYKNATKAPPPGAKPRRSNKLAFGLISEKELTHFMERQLFVAADQMNRGHGLIIDENEVVSLLKLNIKAADYAFNAASFASAKDYLEMAQLILDGRGENDIWTGKYHQMVLQVTSRRAQTYLSLGDWDQGDQLVSTVMEKAHALDIKLPLLVSQIYALRRRDLFPESYHKANDMLLLMKVYPKRNKSMKVMGQLLSVNRYIKQHSDGHILGLPIMKDANMLQAMVAMSELSNVAFMIKEMFDFILTILLRLQMSFKHGLSEETAVAFAAHAITMGMFGNEESANRCARLAISIMQKTKAFRQRGLIVYLVTRFVNSWTLPTGDVLQAFKSAHSFSMEAGAVEIGALAWYNSNMHAFDCGVPLTELSDSAAKNCEECELYKVASVGGAAIEFAGSIQRLSGAVALDFGDLVIDDVAEHIQRMETRWLAWLPVAVIFGNLEIGKQLAKKLSASGDSGYNVLCLREFYSGILYAKLAYKNGKRKHINMLRKHEATMLKLAKVKGSNCKPHAMLLKAARIGLTQPKQIGAIQDAYEEAFGVAERKSRHHDLALGHELLGELYLKNENVSLATVHFTKSCRNYRIWGATGKVEKMEADRFRYINDSELGDTHEVLPPNASQKARISTKVPYSSSDFLIG